jgi:hypothetical protein
MKQQFRILAVFAVIIFGLSSLAHAGDSIGLSVSCTIPAIPGVNAPLNEASTVDPLELEEKERQTSSPDPEPQEEQPQFIEELEEIQLAQQDSPVLTKIIYSR